MQLITISWITTVNYYLICYAFVIIILCFSIIATSADFSSSWNSNVKVSNGIRILLFSSILALTGLPPMFLLAPKLHILCFLFIKSSFINSILFLVLTFLSWFIYYSALRTFSQNNLTKFNTNNNSSNLVTNYASVLASMLLLLILAPFFVDDIILWVYFFVGI